MVKTIIRSLLLLLLVFIIGSYSDPNLIYHIPFEEGQGTRTYLSSDNSMWLYCLKENNDTISPVWLSGPQNTAIAFDSLAISLYGGYGSEFDPLAPRCDVIDSIEGITLAVWMRSPEDYIITDTLDGTLYDTMPTYVGPMINFAYMGRDSNFTSNIIFGQKGNAIGTHGRLHYDCGSSLDKPTPSNDYYYSKWKNTDTEWHHYAITHNYLDSTITMYINGVYDTSFTNPYAMDEEFNRSDNYFLIVKPYPGTVNMPDEPNYGIDELHFFSRVLDSSEIQDLANNEWLDTTIGNDLPSKRINDSLALVALYDSTGGDSWTNHTNWKTCEPINTWYGVTVVNDRVTSLVLNNNNLGGEIPPEIGNLTAMHSLWLHYNSLSGTIPSEVGNLSNLRVLYMHRNYSISGSIPAEIGNLSSLTNLDLSYNSLTGNIPSEIGDLSVLQYLYLYNNNLNDTIPSSLGNLSNLKSLLISNNSLSGSIPSSLGNLSNLTAIWMQSNDLSGEVPSELGNISNLTVLYLYYNDLTSLGDSLVNLTNITNLNIVYNKLCNVSTELTIWLDNLQPYWDDYQTCP